YFFAQGQGCRLADVAQQHVGLFYLIERNIDCCRNRFLVQTLARSDAQVASQNFDDVLAFSCRRNREAILEKLRLRQWAAGPMQVFKQLPGFQDGERPRGCATIKNFKGSSVRVTVTRYDAVKCRVINFRCPLKRADNQRPANLQCTRVALCKSSTGKVGSYDWQL